MIMDAIYDQSLDKSLINFRACGVKNAIKKSAKGLVYRSSQTSDLTLEHAHYLKDLYGIQYVIDLRTEQELEKAGIPQNLLDAGVKWRHSPLNGLENVRSKKSPTAEDYATAYFKLIEDHVTILKGILTFVAETPISSSVLVNCNMGKDRTGLFCAFFLKLLGISLEDLADDYALSFAYLNRHLASFEHRWKTKGLTQEEFQQHLMTPAITIRLLWDKLEAKYVSFDHFVTYWQLTPIIQNLKARFMPSYQIKEQV